MRQKAPEIALVCLIALALALVWRRRRAVRRANPRHLAEHVALTRRVEHFRASRRPAITE